MHKIIWDTGIVSILTSEIDAKEHKHWMLQLFYTPNDTMHLTVEGEKINGRLIVVNQNCVHTFNTEDKVHFSALIMPGTEICEHLIHAYLHNEKYYDFTSMLTGAFNTAFNTLVQNTTIREYRNFTEALKLVLKMENCSMSHENEERVQEIVKHFTGGSTSIQELSNELALSKSRIAHIFKEQTGTPLKSYLLLGQVYAAFEALLQGKSVTEAAMTAGFDTPSHFAATIKKLMGESPSMSIKDSEFLKVF